MAIVPLFPATVTGVVAAAASGYVSSAKTERDSAVSFLLISPPSSWAQSAQTRVGASTFGEVQCTSGTPCS